MKTSKLYAILGLALMTCLTGCGSSGPVAVTDTQVLYATVEGLGDAAGDEAMFAEAFVAGAAPENREEYGEKGYQVVGDPTLDGDTATVPVKIFGGVYASSDSDRNDKPTQASETEQTWTLQKSGSDWKIKDAPLG